MNKKIILAIVAAIVLFIAIVIFTKKILLQEERECGNRNYKEFTNLELPYAPKSVKNNLVRSDDVNHPASNIIDGNERSQAYPSSRQMDYTIDLSALFEIKKITLMWHEYGEKEKYVSNWTVDGCNKNGEWSTLGQGLWPNSKKSILETDEQISEIRLRAESEKNWIGIYEIVIE